MTRESEWRRCCVSSGYKVSEVSTRTLEEAAAQVVHRGRVLVTVSGTLTVINLVTLVGVLLS